MEILSLMVNHVSFTCIIWRTFPNEPFLYDVRFVFLNEGFFSLIMKVINVNWEILKN